MPETRPEDPPIHVTFEGFTSTGGYRYQATEVTRHAGPIARLEVTNAGGAASSPAPVALEPSEAAELGLWLLRNAISHETDAEIRDLLTGRIDAVAGELASVRDDER